MIPFRKSIGFRLFAISFILLALPLLVDSFVLVRKRYEHTIGEAKAHLIELANLRELPLSSIKPLGEHLLILIATQLNLEVEFPKKVTEDLNNKLRGIARVGGFSGVFLLKPTEGKYLVVASNEKEYLGEDYTVFFQLDKETVAASTAEGYSTYISYSSKDHRPYYIATLPIYSTGNKLDGIIAVSYDIAERLKELLASDKRNYTVNFALLLPSGTVFASSEPALQFRNFKPKQEPSIEFFQKEEPQISKSQETIFVDTKKGSPFIEFNWQGVKYVAYLKKVGNGNFSLLTYAKKKEIYQSPFLNFLNLYSVYALILLLGGLIGWLLVKRMAKPVQNLSKVMLGIQKGDSSLRYQKDSLGFEINDLGNTFNNMIDNLLDQKHLAEKERVTKETYAKELLLGRQVQRTLLPQVMPHYGGVELAETYIPAIEVGGDYFDVFVKKSDHHEQLVLSIADASGKGVRACFYSLTLRNIMRTFAKEFSEVGKAMALANNLFCKDTDDTGMFVTAITGIYDNRTHAFQYFSCGHNPALLIRKDGKVEILDHQSMAMGVIPMEKVPRSHSVTLAPQDTLVLYTDGITEAHNLHYHLYGEERLINCLKTASSLSAKEIVKRVVEDVEDFVGKASQHDDITLLVMKILE